MAQMGPPERPTSLDRRSHRPVKKARATATSAQSAAVEALFEKQPEIQIPESATKGPRTAASLAAPPEIVANVQGSSAGAGSGEFHVYKASRRREYERIRIMEEEAKTEQAVLEWEEKQRQNKLLDESKTSKNRKRREKQKALKEGKKDKKEDSDLPMKLKPLRINPLANGNEEQDASNADDGAAVPLASEENGIVMHDDD